MLRDAERSGEKESIALIEKFKSYRKHKFREIQKIIEKDEDADLDQDEDEMIAKVN